jgi:mannose-1-phosphate guanylyltransferase/phosphomannomutase
MVPIVNKPVMEHIIELLASHGMTQVIANLHCYAEAIQGYFDDGSKWGVNITYSMEKSLLGTAGGVRSAKEVLGKETFLVISGDALTDINLTELVKFHKKKKGIATMVLTEVDDPSKYGVVVTSGSGRIVRFQEKPPQGKAKSRLANSGIYVFEPEIFGYIPEGVFYDFGRDLFPLFLEEGLDLYGFTHSDYWNDVGSLEEYQRGNFDALEGKVRVNIPGDLIKEDIWVGGNCEIQEGVILVGPICMGANCLVKKNSKLLGPLIIGDNTIIDEGAVLYKGIKWGDGYIGKDASLIGSIIAHSTQIKDKVAVMEDAVIGHGCVIGGGSVIHPSVRIASDHVIDINSQVKEHIV